MRKLQALFAVLIPFFTFFGCTEPNEDPHPGLTNFLNPNLIYETVNDTDGNIYPTIRIGNQWWMATNLRTTRYCNGDPIPNITLDAPWANLNSPAWAYYQNDSSFNKPYGKLYNWFAVNDSRNLCPCGWKIPNQQDWDSLILAIDPSTLSNNNTIAGKLKSIGTYEERSGLWNDPNEAATNESGFSAIPAGGRNSFGLSQYLGTYALWWTADPKDEVAAWSRNIKNDILALTRYSYSKNNGFSVRCIKEE
jgi:uncharacterized protein (TIGR02145 family)